ncbi:hypothetical protein MCOR25_004201 [Pyricularia grisea]|uniref:RRM domain-containing protein n=1 Tax=Pyricularia grisea TaxID=148305 RepID=A0A6P8AWT9_PYRGI|nr:uncharacterized protein PgNI_08343 [Pyricularia grisea]KAI6370463.1 hypothetical protein MCOR25_004201 [Pyricularia grisea]TLD06688.1 hypothetical protein PgNI_08343 [Pyricularia grisea]
MSAPDPNLPNDTIVVSGDSYTHSEDESMVEDDGLNDIYGDDGDQQAQNGEHAAVDAAPGDKLNQEPVGDDDDYAKSFDSPNPEPDANLEDQDEPSVSEQQESNNATSTDASASNPAAAESTAINSVDEPEIETAPTNSVDSDNLTSSSTAVAASVDPFAAPSTQTALESVAESNDTAKPIISTSQQLQGSQQKEKEHQPQPDVTQVVATQPDTDVSGSEALSATVPKNSHYSHDDAANDANLAFDIQELVKDIKAASSPSPSASSGSSSESDSSGEMQIDAESPPPPESSTSLETSVPVSLVNVPTETTSVTDAESVTLTELTSIPLMPNASLPAPVQGRAQSSKKANGGKKGKKESQVPLNAPSAPANARAPPAGPKGQGQNNNRQGNNQRVVTQTYEGFVNDERRYTAEAKWEKFPEGSRIFVGNLSQDRATKKEVFNIFHPYGRLAQISLKSAYGFVQYHAASEAAEAIKHLQGVDVRGRKLNLEVSKTQKRNGKERERSPDRNDRNKKRKSDSFDAGRETGRNTDGYRPSYDQPRRGDRHGEDSRGRYGDRGRSRSRSPRPYSRNEDHRQRSPLRGSYSDQRGHDSSRDPHPHAIAPDSQILLLEDVNRDFIQYVKKAFTDVGLTTDVMFVDVRAMDNVQQRLIMQGAHASVQLDMRAQTIGKVTMRVFKRTPGVSHVSYDEYRDLDVNIAASLVLQTKNMSRPQQAPPPTYPPHASSGYPHAYAAPAYGAPAHTMPAQQPVMPGALGQVDPAILQRVLMQLNGGQPQAHAAPAAYGALPHVPVMAPAPAAPAPGPASQIDINAILNNLRSASANSVPAPGPGTAPYGTAAPYPGVPNPMSPVTGGPGTAPHAGATNANQHVQNIMAQLSRFRQ